MKRILLLSICLLAITFAKGQAPADSLYVVTYTTGPSWIATKVPFEQEYFKEHSTHLASLRKSGVIKLGARHGEKGMIVISAKTLSDAKAIIEKDPAVVNKLFEAVIEPFLVFYDGCVERSK